MRATLHAIQTELRKRMHRPNGDTGRWLRRVVQGWLNYHAVPFNMKRLDRFVRLVSRLWLFVLRRRSQRTANLHFRQERQLRLACAGACFRG
jgi:hypothetical protein